MLAAMSRSKVTDPDWKRQKDANYQAVLAQIQQRTREMTAPHNANMA